MDLGGALWLVCLALGLVGAPLFAGSVHRLARSRAAASWPGPDRSASAGGTGAGNEPPGVYRRVRTSGDVPAARRVPYLERAAGYLGTAAGLVLLAVGSALAMADLARPPGPVPVPDGWRGWSIAILTALVTLAAGGFGAVKLLDRGELTALIRASGTAVPPLVTNATGISADTETLDGPSSSAGARTAPSCSTTESNEPSRRPVTERTRPAGGQAAVPAGGQSAVPAGQAAVPAGQAAVEAAPVSPARGRSGWVYRDRTGVWYMAVGGAGVPARSGLPDDGRWLLRLGDFTLVPESAVSTPLTLAGSAEIAVWPPDEAAPQPGAPA